MFIANLKKLPWVQFWNKNQPLDPEWVVDRFIFDRKPRHPHPSFFQSQSLGDDLSVFQGTYLTESALWEIGKRANPQRTLKAKCRLKVKKVICMTNERDKKRFGLWVLRSPETASKANFTFSQRWWHANIGNCPKNEEENKLMVLGLVEIAEYEVCPDFKK